MSFKSYLHIFTGKRRKYAIGGGIAAIVLAAIGINILTRAAPAPTPAPQVSQVSLASVAGLSTSAGPLEITGVVTSESQASILAQTSGEIVTLSHSLGDRVSAGSVIAQFENSGQRAAVTQAQGAYNAAQAALAKAEGTTASNSSVSSSQAQTAAANAAASGAAALTSAYAALDDAVHAKADQLFTNPRTSSPTFTLIVPDSVLSNTIVNERSSLESTLAHANRTAQTASASDFDAESEAMIADARIVQSFLSDVITAVNKVPPSASISASALAGYQASLSGARSEVVGALSSVQAAKSAYDAAVAGATTASNSATSGTDNDIKAAQANALSAEGTLAAAESALEKTIVRSPISGTIVSLPVTQGDFVSAFSPVAIVSNPGALYIDAQVTPDDAATLAVGNAATIDASVPGVITFIAPALDPSTGKIEVKVGVTVNAETLTDGETVTLALTRRQSAIAKPTAALTIPIIAVKIAPTGPEVFSVGSTSALEAHPIILGTILGDRVTVSGITGDLIIVTDARGLAEGQQVVVAGAASSTPPL